MSLIEQHFIQSTAKRVKIKGTDLELVPINMPVDYANKWNERKTDFLVLCRDGDTVNDCYYRLGGLFTNKGGDFIRIIKYVESYYDKNLTKETRESIGNRRHLAGHFCLINKEGKETKVFDRFDNPYLLGNCIYSVNDKFYNAFTNKFYCTSYSTMESENYFFLDGSYEKEDRKGIYKINKKTGEFTIIR